MFSQRIKKNLDTFLMQKSLLCNFASWLIELVEIHENLKNNVQASLHIGCSNALK